MSFANPATAPRLLGPAAATQPPCSLPPAAAIGTRSPSLSRRLHATPLRRLSLQSPSPPQDAIRRIAAGIVEGRARRWSHGYGGFWTWLRPTSFPFLPVSMCLNGSDTSTQDFEVNSTLNYTEDQQEIGEPVKLYPASEQVDGKQGTEMLDNKEDLSLQRKGAKIHDFCLGIPFGGIVFGGGLFGFLFSKTPATSMLSGAAILAMGFISLKVWRQGKSSLPLILGQAAIAATLFWKHFQLYPVTKKIFPSGFYVLISAAMLCFYSYVLIAGGNPPPKKKLAASPSS